ncbi:MAG: flagellar hook assembly protein FlgD [Betaproteobacteria bacterium]|nr:flagellar hook assembly protein FlgD [Betaproteobacteria bacterium]
MATIDPFTSLNSATTASTTSTTNAANSADRFLRLLVTQMQNQDPLNPLDNAQVTSQMAQINTVSGVEKLNETVAGLNRQFIQMQALQGASLVGRAVTLQGDRLHVNEGTAAGGFELAAPADRVRVEVLNGAGRVVDTLDLGAQTTGRHGFEWQAPADTTEGSEFRFRVTATSGTVTVPSTALMRDEVDAVALVGDTLRLETRWSGTVDYSAVRAIN